MLKMLRADFYKIVRSKTLVILFIVYLLTAIAPSLAMLINSSDRSVLDLIYDMHITASLSWILIVPFACKDLSSKYIKNVLPTYKQKDKAYYVLSKVIYIFIFCVLYAITTFVLTTIFNLAFGSGIIYDKLNESFTLGEFALNEFTEILNATAVGTFILFLSMILNKEYLVLVVILPYMTFFQPMVYEAIEYIIFKSIGQHFNDLPMYTVFGPITTSFAYDKLPIIIGMSLLYTAAFSVLGWLVFRKRSY